MKYVKNPETGRVWVDMTGAKIGRWTVLSLAGRRMTKAGLPQGPTMWRCQCDCGKVKEQVNYGALMNGTSLSCGCLRGEMVSARAKVHGRSGSKVYLAWQMAKDRCFRKGGARWENYGGRGITVCEGFVGSFPAWAAALGEPPTPKHSVDRIDNEGNYSCGMCSQCVENRWKFNIHWATRPEQANNTRTNRIFSWKGESLTITNIARQENVAFCSLRNLLVDLKMDVGEAVRYCQSRGLTFKERSQTILDENPHLTPPPPKHRRKRRKRALPQTEREMRRYTAEALKDMFDAAGVAMPERKMRIDG